MLSSILCGAWLTRSGQVMLVIRDSVTTFRNIIHRIASNGEAVTLKTTNYWYYEDIYLPLLLGQCVYTSLFHNTVYRNYRVNVNHVINLPNVAQYGSIIGDLYYMETKEDGKHIGHLVDIATEEIIRVFDLNKSRKHTDVLLGGILTHGYIRSDGDYTPKDKSLTIHGFGAL
jgi:hypothetical protein